jgi:hypothetical protein
MAKAAKAKLRPKPKPKFTDKEQSERFIEAARELGVDTPSEAFDAAFEKVAKVRPRRET